jgi:hypothetical protein
MIVSEMERVLFEVFDEICARIRRDGEGKLRPEERAFLAIWMLESEVNNGGFAQYAFNSSGDDAPVARSALDHVGARATLAVFDDFVALFPDGRLAPTRDARQRQLDELAARHGEAACDAMLDALDRRFYATENELRRCVFAFAQRELIT